MGRLEAVDVQAALRDPSPTVRRRGCEVGWRLAEVDDADLVARLRDADPMVAEAAAWALGERGSAGDDGAPAPGAPPPASSPLVVDALSEMVASHEDPLCREAAVAALGAIGDDRGLAAILHATQDKPAVRRRAVLALAPFDGPDVDAALERALTDRDWQVRQAAEDLTRDD